MRSVVRAPGVSSICSPTSSSTSAGRPASVATRRCSDSAKSSSPRIAASVTSATAASAPDPGGQHLDDLALDQCRVDVKDDEPLGPSRQAVVLERDVDTLVDRDPRHRRLQPLVNPVRRHRHPQLQTRYGIVGDAADEVDVDAERGHFAGHHAERLGGDRPAQHDDGVGGRLAHHRQRVAALDRHVEADTVDGGLHLVAQLGPAGHFRRTGHQDAQRQAAADDDLFDVEELDLVPRQHLEQRRRHAWLIVSGDGDQHRHLGHAHPRLPPA